MPVQNASLGTLVQASERAHSGASARAVTPAREASWASAPDAP